MPEPIFALHITTKNRKSDLAFTLNKITAILEDKSLECFIYDDGSSDGTYEFLQDHYPQIKLYRNTVSKGLIFCRNKMLNDSAACFVISLDDDAHFMTENPLCLIREHFERNPDCGLLALRIFWGLDEPVNQISDEKTQKVQGFVGCAHVWRMKAWREIPNYPEWFVFYGEEDFAALQLYKKHWKIHYFPKILVQHRVEVKSRKQDADYSLRLRRSLRAGWYLFFLFSPVATIPRKMAYSLWIQFKIKVFKGDLRALKAIWLALLDLFFSLPKIIKHSNRLSWNEYNDYQKLPPAKIYWQPEK
jgi:glycosyltransferase involved in cell wall biosynthesis